MLQPSKNPPPGVHLKEGPVPSLRHVVLDNQQGTGGGGGVIAAVELKVVGTHIIVIILLEAQAELGSAGLIDIGAGCAAQDNSIPA